MALNKDVYTKSVSIDGRSMSFAIRPGGERVVSLIHGLQDRWQTFRRVISSINSNWTVVALDLRGHGCSEWVSGRYSLDDFSADYVTFHRMVIGDRPSIIYGHSLGGWVAAISEPALRHSLIAIGIEDSAFYEPSHSQKMMMSDFAVPSALMKSLNQAQRVSDPELQKRWFEKQSYKERDPCEMLSLLRTPLLLVRADPRKGGLLSSVAAGKALENVEVPYREVFVPESSHSVHSQFPRIVANSIISFANDCLGFAA